MAERVHGRHLADLPRVEARMRSHHRPDRLVVESGADGWSVTCGWWHVAPDNECVPVGGGSFDEPVRADGRAGPR